jgi:hypothetical protein
MGLCIVFPFCHFIVNNKNRGEAAREPYFRAWFSVVDTALIPVHAFHRIASGIMPVE